VRFILLTSKPESPYADTATSYEYPAQYRKYFAPLDAGEPMIAILYEPGDRGRGRMAYVGWAAIAGVPTPSPRRTERGYPLWEVRYVGRAEDFNYPVPLRYLGQPIERWLRDAPASGRALRGRSVRALEEADATLILELGRAEPIGAYPMVGGVEAKVAELEIPERARRVVEALTRDVRFRRDVMAAYEFTCAVTGLGIGVLPQGRATRLLDAAHIRPVGDKGVDLVSNGIALTPTVHRLFDEGLVTARWSGDRLEVLRSPMLDPTMIEASERGTKIKIETGAALILPSDRGKWPNPDQIRYHQRRVFKGPESMLGAIS
jgi:putative restriction endonuclease